jgi:hypothetical protein
MLGRDSQLTFVAPDDGDYLVKLRDVRGLQGEDFHYDLAIRPPRPDLRVKVLNENPKVGVNSGRKFGVEVERIDGFDGPITVEVKNLPAGFSVAGPLVVEAGHDRAWGTLLADKDAVAPSPEDCEKVSLLASARIGDQRIERPFGNLGQIELDTSPTLWVELVPDHEPTHGTADLPVIEVEQGGTTTATIRIQRHGHEGRVDLGKEDAAVNAPHGVYVDNIGLNGVLIVEGQDERQFFITVEPWVQPMERLIFVEASEAGSPTSAPVILRVLPQQPTAGQQVSR